MKHLKLFFNTVQFEFVKIYRNKTVFIILLLFTTAMLVLMSFAGDIGTGVKDKNYNSKIKIGINTNNVNLTEDVAGDILTDLIDINKCEKIDNIEDGIYKVNSSDLDLFINIEIENTPHTILVYYDQTNIVANEMISFISQKTNGYIEKVTNDYLSVIGIKVDKEYFNIVSYEPTNKIILGQRQRVFSMATIVSLGIVIIFGLAYSMARENETQTIKNICYMPMGVNKYLCAKIIPFLALGVFQFLISILIGSFLYKINIQVHFILYVVITIFFLFALICLGLLLSMFKSQIATALIGVFFILVPVFSSVTTLMIDLPEFIKLIMYLIPGIPFLIVFNAMTFNGVIIVKYILVLIFQSVLFYMLSYFVLKRKIQK